MIPWFFECMLTYNRHKGVTFIQVIEGDGMSERLLDAGLAEWRRRHTVPEEDGKETQSEE